MLQFPQHLLTPLTWLLNRYFHHPAYQTLWVPLQGTVLQITVAEMGTLYVECLSDKLQLYNTLNTAGASPTVFIEGPAKAFMRLGPPPHDLDAAKKLGLTITGDLEAALRLSQIGKHPPIDIEERLSGLIGDTAAHTLAQTATHIKKRVTENTNSFLHMLADYWQEETPALPAPAEIQAWISEVDVLRDRTECLAARLAQLKAQQDSCSDDKTC